MQHKIEKANSTLQKKVGEIIYREVELPEIFVSINRVEVTPNLGSAKIFLNCLPADKEEEALKIMVAHRQIIRQKLSRQVKTRRIPELFFFIDEKEKKDEESRVEIEEIIQKIKKNDNH
jgi:ribosome-binding factor A